MKIEDNLRIASLIDTFGSLLTSKQFSIITSYYFDNLSLSEIGDNFSISRQAVSDSINQSIKALEGYEEKLRIIEKENLLIAKLESIKNKIVDSDLSAQITQIIDDIRG
jgi:predicted DNA-binding protein YlxM (UPF0122 family)